MGRVGCQLQSRTTSLWYRSTSITRPVMTSAPAERRREEHGGRGIGQGGRGWQKPCREELLCREKAVVAGGAKAAEAGQVLRPSPPRRGQPLQKGCQMRLPW